MTIYRQFRNRLRAGTIAGGLALLLADAAWSQVVPELPPPLPDPPKVEAPTEIIKDAKEPVRDVRDDAKDALKPPREDVRDAAKDARDATRDATRDAVRDTRDAVRDPLDTTRDAVRDPLDTTRDAVRDPLDTTRDAVREPLDTTRDAVRDTTRDAVRVENLRAADLGVTFGPTRNGWLSVSALAPSAAIGRIGLRSGDYILSVNGQRLTREADFVRYLLAEESRAARLPMVVWRDGRQMTIEVEPALLLAGLSSTSSTPGGTVAQFGIVVDSRYPEQVVVQQVVPRSPAQMADIRAGDVLTAIDGQRLASAADLESFLAAQRRSTVRVDLLRQTQVNLAFNSTTAPHTTYRPIETSGNRGVLPAQPTYSPAVEIGTQPIYDESYPTGRRGLFGRSR